MLVNTCVVSRECGWMTNRWETGVDVGTTAAKVVTKEKQGLALVPPPKVVTKGKQGLALGPPQPRSSSIA